MRIATSKRAKPAAKCYCSPAPEPSRRRTVAARAAEESVMKIDIGIGDIASRPADFTELAAQAKRAEDAGFASAWLANIFGVDAMTAATVCGLATKKIAIGTGVVPTYPRHPFAMAQQTLSVNGAIGNRFTLGIGLSHQIVIEAMLGMSYAKSYSHMQEYLAVLAPLIREGKVQFSGSSY